MKMRKTSKCDMREMKQPPFHTSPETNSVRGKYTVFNRAVDVVIFQFSGQYHSFRCLTMLKIYDLFTLKSSIQSQSQERGCEITMHSFFVFYRCFHMYGLTEIKLYFTFIFTIYIVNKIEHLKTWIPHSILIKCYKTACMSIF